MNNQQHLVLGGSGSVGSAVIEELVKRGLNVKAVERTKDVQDVATIKADLLDAEQALNAIAGSDYVYLCVGLPYDAAYWQNNWPKLMENVVNACSSANAKLIFLDNVYMYGAPLSVPFDEQSPQTASTRKGLARKQTADILLAAQQKGSVKALIGRSADFYGPKAFNSILYITFLNNMIKNKSAQWLGSPTAKHTYAYTGDNGRALVSLALDDGCYGQVWHLPVGNPVDAHELLAIFNSELNGSFKLAVMPRMLATLLALFIKPLKEAQEMSYQFDNDYIMSDAKFRAHFPDFKTTTYQDGIHKMVESTKS